MPGNPYDIAPDVFPASTCYGLPARNYGTIVVRRKGIMLAKKTSKNQITIPRDIARKFPDTVYFDVVIDDGRILLRPVRFSSEGSVLKMAKLKMKQLGLTERDVEEAVTWARKAAKQNA
jgi:bifunctional DNA-binding transcriptional regulator/antitoxin component of YhaV-PrlF toxin-antitoxin module